jgi:3-deoxy-D-manno-octulosonic-acid transferase
MNRLLLWVYNLLFAPVLLAMLPSALMRARRRGGFAGTLTARLGFPPRDILKRAGTGRIWIHSVSVGEVGIALKFCTAFRQRNPGARFLLSSTTPTGLAVAESGRKEGIDILPNPLDLPVLTARLMRILRPSALLFVEADLWPNRIAAAKRLGIPVALINARLSPRSERRFRLVRPLSTAFFGQLDLITLSDEEDRERFLGLGVPGDRLRLTGNIKHDQPPGRSGTSPADRREPLLLAASTHRGEEEEIARAWMELRPSRPGLRLVIAPRHAERRREIRDTLGSLGLSCSFRSEGGELSEVPLILDTTGELSSWYPRAAVAFVGKSLPCSVNGGGQNMIEPLRAGTPVLIGPRTANFEPIASRLFSAGAALRVHDHGDIAAAVDSLLKGESQRNAMIAAANEVLEPHQGAALRNCELLESLLPSLRPSVANRQP